MTRRDVLQAVLLLAVPPLSGVAAGCAVRLSGEPGMAGLRQVVPPVAMGVAALSAIAAPLWAVIPDAEDRMASRVAMAVTGITT